ncbi:hypothetical protein [Polymorphospora sp. NPDC050346]|uniref:hypothetical protein n=1 Tax=Polymorphospora sp. NPDC050346 TaxID=3155780 RepID=UPI003407B43F
MSEAAWLVCWECRVTLCLGKAVKEEHSDRITAYVTPAGVGSVDPVRTRALWRMMADHVGHPLEVVREFSRRFDDVGELDENGDDVYADIDAREFARDYAG